MDDIDKVIYQIWDSKNLFLYAFEVSNCVRNPLKLYKRIACEENYRIHKVMFYREDEIFSEYRLQNLINFIGKPNKLIKNTL